MQGSGRIGATRFTPHARHPPPLLVLGDETEDGNNSHLSSPVFSKFSYCPVPTNAIVWAKNGDIRPLTRLLLTSISTPFPATNPTGAGHCILKTRWVAMDRNGPQWTAMVCMYMPFISIRRIVTIEMAILLPWPFVAIQKVSGCAFATTVKRVRD